MVGRESESRDEPRNEADTWWWKSVALVLIASAWWPFRRRR